MRIRRVPVTLFMSESMLASLAAASIDAKSQSRFAEEMLRWYMADPSRAPAALVRQTKRLEATPPKQVSGHKTLSLDPAVIEFVNKAAEQYDRTNQAMLRALVEDTLLHRPQLVVGHQQRPD